MSGGGAGTQQGAQYYNGVDAAFGGVLVALVAEPAASWKLSADLPDSVVLRLRWAVCGKSKNPGLTAIITITKQRALNVGPLMRLCA